MSAEAAIAHADGGAQRTLAPIVGGLLLLHVHERHRADSSWRMASAMPATFWSWPTCALRSSRASATSTSHICSWMAGCGSVPSRHWWYNCSPQPNQTRERLRVSLGTPASSDFLVRLCWGRVYGAVPVDAARGALMRNRWVSRPVHFHWTSWEPESPPPCGAARHLSLSLLRISRWPSAPRSLT